MKKMILAVAAACVFAAAAQHEAPPAEKAPSGHENPAAAEAAKPAGAHGEQHASGEHNTGHAGDPYLWWKIANFALLAGALGYFIGKKGGPFFRARTEEIRKGIDEAAAMKLDAGKRAAEVEARLKRLDDDIAALRSAAKQEVAAEGERVRAETGEHIAKIQAGAEQEIASAAKAARQELRAYSADLALSLAEAQLMARVTPDVQASLLDRFVHGLDKERVQ